MKLKKVSQPPSVDYPTYGEYHAQREATLRRLALGTGALLAAGIATSCRPPRTAGLTVAPTPAIERPEARLLGDVAVPQPPAVTPATGQTASPSPPPVRLQGEVSAPTPVPEPQEPAVLGKIAAPQPVPPPRLLGTPAALPPPPEPAK